MFVSIPLVLQITEEASNQVADNVLVKEEEKEVGVVAFSVFLAYWSAVGLFLAPTILFALLLMQGQFTKVAL